MKKYATITLSDGTVFRFLMTVQKLLEILEKGESFAMHIYLLVVIYPPHQESFTDHAVLAWVMTHKNDIKEMSKDTVL